jgi:acyl-CoA hydrolase
MKEKKVADSSVTLSIIMQPQDANMSGNVHGGVIMKHIDDAAGMVALRHAGCNVVTASIDRLDFHNPAFIGNLLTLKACLNMVGKSSMEIGVRVEAENPLSGAISHIASAYLTFVALDKDFRPTPVPPLKLETESAKRRNKEAIARHKIRLSEKNKEKICQSDITRCEV